MQFKHVTLEFDGGVAVLTLDHQEVMNAVSVEMLGSLIEALDEIDSRRGEARCLLITGAGRAFCTGANLQGRNTQKPGRSNAGAALETAFHPFLRRLRNLYCPVVTAVNGPAAGAGGNQNTSARHLQRLGMLGHRPGSLRLRHVKRSHNLAGIALARLQDR